MQACQISDPSRKVVILKCQIEMRIQLESSNSVMSSLQILKDGTTKSSCSFCSCCIMSVSAVNYNWTMITWSREPKPDLLLLKSQELPVVHTVEKKKTVIENRKIDTDSSTKCIKKSKNVQAHESQTGPETKISPCEVKETDTITH